MDFRISLLPRHAATLAAAFAAAASMPLGALAQAPGADALTLAATVERAAADSRQLAAADAQLRAAREVIVSAGQLPDPVLKLGVINVPTDGADRWSLTRDFMTMRTLAVMQEITRDAKRDARTERAEREAQADEAARALVLATVQRDAALAWIDRSYLESQRALLDAQLREAGLQIDAAEAAYRGAKGTQADVFAARTQAEQMRDRIAQMDRQIAGATARLARWIGDAAAQPLSARPAWDAPEIADANLDAMLQHHPQITSLTGQTAIAEADAKLADANRQSDWSLEVMFSQRGPAYSNMVSVNVSIPLQWDRKNRQDRELAAKLAQVDQMRAQRDDALRAHVAEVRAMLDEWRSNRARLQRYDESLIPLAQQRSGAALAAYRGATGTLSMVLDARRAELDVRMERLQLDADLARLWAQLHYLTPQDAAANHREPS